MNCGVEAKTFGAETETAVLVAIMIEFPTSVRSLPPRDHVRQVVTVPKGVRFFPQAEHTLRRVEMEKGPPNWRTFYMERVCVDSDAEGWGVVGL